MNQLPDRTLRSVCALWRISALQTKPPGTLLLLACLQHLAAIHTQPVSEHLRTSSDYASLSWALV